MNRKFYVVEKILLKWHAAAPDDLIRVEKIDAKNNRVVLQPMLKDKYVVSLSRYVKDYRKA